MKKRKSLKHNLITIYVLCAKYTGGNIRLIQYIFNVYDIRPPSDRLVVFCHI